MCHGSKVLIIENDPFQAKLHSCSLRSAGYKVSIIDHYSTLEELLAFVVEHEPDLVLVDEMLSGWGISGHEIVRHIQERDDLSPIIAVLSIVASSPHIAGIYSGLHIPSNQLLQKPVSLDDLVSFINRLLPLQVKD